MKPTPFKTLSLLLIPLFASAKTQTLSRLTDFGSTPLAEIVQGPTVGVVFQKNCSFCREQVTSLGCLAKDAKVVLFGAFSSERELRQEVKTLASSYSSYHATAETLREWGVVDDLTPQILIFKGGRTIKPHVMVGFKRCETIQSELNKVLKGAS